MKNLGTKISGVALAATAMVTVMCGAAFAATPTPESTVTSAATDLRDSLLSIGTTVLPLGAAILALTIGWRFAKKFVRG